MSLEEVLVGFITESPTMGFVLILVVIFLKHLAKRDEVIEKIATENNAIVKENSLAMGGCIELMRDTRKWIGKLSDKH